MKSYYSQQVMLNYRPLPAEPAAPRAGALGGGEGLQPAASRARAERAAAAAPRPGAPDI